MGVAETFEDVGGSLKEQQELSQATERERPQVKSPPANPPNRNHVQPTTPPNRSGQTHRPPPPRRAQSLLRQRTHLPLLAQLHRHPGRPGRRPPQLRRPRRHALRPRDLPLASKKHPDERAGWL